jgi:phosphotransferase system HPr (HPr) family protein
MVTRKLKVEGGHELEARTAAAMVFSLDAYASKVVVRRGERTADARSILDLLQLGASTGGVIEVTAAGTDEEQAIAAIAALVLEAFDGDGRAGRN